MTYVVHLIIREEHGMLTSDSDHGQKGSIGIDSRQTKEQVIVIVQSMLIDYRLRQSYTTLLKEEDWWYQAYDTNYNNKST